MRVESWMSTMSKAQAHQPDAECMEQLLDYLQVHGWLSMREILPNVSFARSTIRQRVNELRSRGLVERRIDVANPTGYEYLLKDSYSINTDVELSSRTVKRLQYQIHQEPFRFISACCQRKVRPTRQQLICQGCNQHTNHIRDKKLEQVWLE